MKKTYYIMALWILFCICGCVSLKPEKPEFEYAPPIEKWVDDFEAGYLCREQFITLIKGSLEIKEMEGIKIVSYFKTYKKRGQYRGMKKLAKETRKKVEMELEVCEGIK